MQQKAVLPDNIHFYKKNPNNALPVNLGGGEISLDYTKSTGESEVAINLLGIPRSETRGVLYEDVSTYGINPNTWVYNVIPQIFSTFGQQGADPNVFTADFKRVLSRTRLSNRPVTLLAGNSLMWQPNAIDTNCVGVSITQGNKYKIYNNTFLPVIYHDAETSCITLEGWPSDYGYLLPDLPSRCSPPPGAWYQDNKFSCNYECKLESRETYRYEPGKVIGFTFGISTSVDETLGFNYCENKPQHKQAKWGVRNNTDSYYFLLDGTELKLIRESIFVENSVVLTSDKFLDKLDGTGPSKAKIDFSKVTMFTIEFSWYGAIGATFFAYLPVGLNETKWVKIAELPSSNTFNVPALSDPYMKMFMELSIPWRVKKPHFLKKYGTSVYMDGAGVKNPNFSKSGSINTPIKNIEKNYNKNIFVVEVPEKNEIGIGKPNKNKFNPLEIEAYFDENVLLTVEKVLDNNKYHYTMPLLTLGLTGIQNINKMFYDNSGKPYDYNTSNLTNPNAGKLQEYSDSIFDFVLPFVGDVYANSEFIDVNIPNNYDINDVTRSLLFNFLLVRSTLPNYRNTWANIAACYPSARRNFDFFNYVRGVEILPKILSITRRSDRVLRLNIPKGKYLHTAWYPSDGIMVTPPKNLSHLDDSFVNSIGGVQNYPNYNDGYAGLNTLNQKPYGGHISIQQPPYNNTSKVLVNKNYYNNQSYYIVNTKIDTGTIRFQPPEGEYMVGFLSQSKLDYLISVNFFKNTTISVGQTLLSQFNNVQDYLLNNSTVNCHRYLNFKWPGEVDYEIFKKTEPIRSIYYDQYGYLKKEYYVKTLGYFELNSRPMTPYNGTFHLLPFIRAGGSNNVLQVVDSLESQTFGFTIKRIKAKIKLTNASLISTSTNNFGRYRVSFNDVSYLRDGVYTSSINFWNMLLNNINNLNSGASFYVQGTKLSQPIFSQGPYNFITKPIDLTFDFSLNRSLYPNGALVDVDLRIMTYTSMQKPGGFGGASTSGPLKEDFGLATTAVIPESENMYFFFASTSDLSGSKNYYYANKQGIKTNVDSYDNDAWCPECEGKNQYDHKFCFTKFEVRDKNGIKSSNPSSVYNNGYYIEKDLWVKSDMQYMGAKQSMIALSGTAYQQNVTKLKYFNSNFYVEDNNYPQNFYKDFGSKKSTYTFIIPKNTKKNINLRYIFNLDRERLLPTLYSDFTEFNTFLIIKARTLGAETAQGNITFNFEELI